MIYGITLAVLGILAAPSLPLSKRPDAKELLSKIASFQGWIGLAFFFWGIWGIIQAVLNFGLLGGNPIWWITWIANSALVASLGFLLGYGMISNMIFSENEITREKGELFLQKLSPWQGRLGLIAIVLGIWSIVVSLLFY
jgi:hypothetical protein